MNTLHNQIAVITGASSGIGRAIALALAAHGASLCLLGRKRESLELVAEAAQGQGHRCYEVDLAVDREVDELIARLQRDTPSVDILIHSAGVIWLGGIDAATADQLDSHYKVNLRAPYLLTQGLLPGLKAREGQVVFINSSAGLAAEANAGQYAASKHALKAVADSLRQEANPAGVRVLSLFPGRTASPMQAAIHAEEGKPYQPDVLIQPQDVAAVVLHALTLPRSVEVTEISMRPMVKSY